MPRGLLLCEECHRLRLLAGQANESRLCQPGRNCGPLHGQQSEAAAGQRSSDQFLALPGGGCPAGAADMPEEPGVH